MSAIAAPTRAAARKGWCPGALRPMETGDGLLARVRAPRGRLSLDQAAALAESRDCLRQWRDRPFFPRQSAPARLERAHACPTCMRALRTPGSSTPIPRSSACATSSQVRSTTSIPKPCSISDRASRRWRRGSAADEDLRRLPAKFSFVLDALGRLPLGDVDADIRFEASRDGTLAVYLAGDDALAAQCAPGETGDVAARLGRAFLALPALAKRRRGGCARWSSAWGRWPCSPRRVSRDEAARAFATARFVARHPRRARIRRGGRRRRGGGVRRNRGRPISWR